MTNPTDQVPPGKSKPSSSSSKKSSASKVADTDDSSKVGKNSANNKTPAVSKQTGTTAKPKPAAAKSTTKNSTAKAVKTTPESSPQSKQPSMNQAASKQSPSTEQPPAAAQTPPSEPVVVKGGGKGLAFFAILLSLLALAGVGFTWYQTQVENERANAKLASGVTEIGGQVSRLGDSLSRLQTDQAGVVTQEQLSTKLLESSNAIDLQMRELKTDQGDLLEAVEKINGDLRKGVNEFVLDEVSQLLKLANNSAVFAGNAQSAISALQLADTQLKELADPRFSEVRRKIGQEVALLKGIKTVDIENLSARLGVLASKVSSLPLENEPPKGPSVDIVEQPSQENVSWRSELRRMWSDIINSVQVQRVDQPPKPLLAPEQRYFLNQNLQLQLSKAELAVLQDRPTVYTQSLESAAAWLNDYFDLQDPEVQAALQELQSLKTAPLGLELPSVAGSYSLLQSIKGGQ